MVHPSVNVSTLHDEVVFLHVTCLRLEWVFGFNAMIKHGHFNRIRVITWSVFVTQNICVKVLDVTRSPCSVTWASHAHESNVEALATVPNQCVMGKWFLDSAIASMCRIDFIICKWMSNTYAVGVITAHVPIMHYRLNTEIPADVPFWHRWLLTHHDVVYGMIRIRFTVWYVFDVVYGMIRIRCRVSWVKTGRFTRRRWELKEHVETEQLMLFTEERWITQWTWMSWLVARGRFATTRTHLKNVQKW